MLIFYAVGWEAGALMGALIDYWYYTGDDTYNEIIQQGILHQAGPYNDFMPPNQTLTEGNDDQGFWGMAVMSAAEYNFDNPPSDKPQWLALAQAVFNTQAQRWDTQSCNGGLRWQIFTWNNGFNYKNSISQACFFNIAARLALYTGNATYASWAIKTWDWMVGVKFIDHNYRVYDGAHVETNCSDVNPYEFSYNVGAFLHGAAAMVQYSAKQGKAGDIEIWHERVDGLLNSTELIFFYGNDTSDKVMIEIACEGVDLCDVDQQSFKAYLSRWMAATTKWAPWTFDRIKTLLTNSAVAAVQQCTGGANQRMCGLKWANNSGQWDGSTGVGQQMAAMEVVLANMIHEAKPPVTNLTGGTSVGDPAAGGDDIGRNEPPKWHYAPITTGHRVGAAFVTFAIVAALLAAIVFMVGDMKGNEDIVTRQDLDHTAARHLDAKEVPPQEPPGRRPGRPLSAHVPIRYVWADGTSSRKLGKRRQVGSGNTQAPVKYVRHIRSPSWVSPRRRHCNFSRGHPSVKYSRPKDAALQNPPRRRPILNSSSPASLRLLATGTPASYVPRYRPDMHNEAARY
ncbi:glycosyl hydrolase family 76-domain-containing protein [Poronia punctata]|nr:glycosyl hydrolase family 76-domain-containing protein [Poronia punctata]